jgi:hypothetical protein
MYEVETAAVTMDCNDVWQFRTEREARAFINERADGSRVFTLLDPDGEVVVRSAFPVLMVA